MSGVVSTVQCNYADVSETVLIYTTALSQSSSRGSLKNVMFYLFY